MEPGAAYWIHSDGASDYNGPLGVSFEGSAAGGVVFTEAGEVKRIKLRNRSDFPQSLSLSLAPGETGQIPVTQVVRLIGGPDQPVERVSIPVSGPLQLGSLEPGEAFFIELEVAQEGVTEPLMGTTLSIHSDAGVRHEVPLVSIRRDLINP